MVCNFVRWDMRRKCMTIFQIVHFLREKPHYFLSSLLHCYNQGPFLRSKSMIDMGGLFCLLSKIKSSMKDSNIPKNLLLSFECWISWCCQMQNQWWIWIHFDHQWFPTAIIQIIHHGWIQNHRQEKIQNHFLDPKKKNSEHHNYKDEQRKVQRDPIGAQFWKID